MERPRQPWFALMPRQFRFVLAGAMFLVVAPLSGTYAYKVPGWSVVPLTPELIEKAIECWPSVFEARDRLVKVVPGDSR